MNFLADMGVSMTTVGAVRHLGHNGRIVLTFDLDFGEIMALSGHVSPSVILFRMRNKRHA